MNKEKGKPGLGELDIAALQPGLILYNDEINTFDFVIKCLIDICGHEYEQAEQCTLTAHFNGKCHVKSGDIQELKPMCKALSMMGLTVAIE